VPLKLDVTSDDDVVAAAQAAGDVNLLVNNAGIGNFGGLLADGAVEAAREQLEVNFFGPLRMARAFAPVLAKNGGGAIINVLSVASWRIRPGMTTYAASKSAAWALTNGLRIDLAQQGTQVVGLHAALIDTDLVRDFDAPKSSPEEIVRTTLGALEREERQVLADEITRKVHSGLSADPPIYLFRAPQRFGRARVCPLAEPANSSLSLHQGGTLRILGVCDTERASRASRHFEGPRGRPTRGSRPGHGSR
jgi:NAD(P)-dependent dehydrogenase (short-subunit alcohol dehydrogenase family)